VLGDALLRTIFLRFQEQQVRIGNDCRYEVRARTV